MKRQRRTLKSVSYTMRLQRLASRSAKNRARATPVTAILKFLARRSPLLLAVMLWWFQKRIPDLFD